MKWIEWIQKFYQIWQTMSWKQQQKYFFGIALEINTIKNKNKNFEVTEISFQFPNGVSSSPNNVAHSMDQLYRNNLCIDIEEEIWLLCFLIQWASNEASKYECKNHFDFF